MLNTHPILIYVDHYQLHTAIIMKHHLSTGYLYTIKIYDPEGIHTASYVSNTKDHALCTAADALRKIAG